MNYKIKNHNIRIPKDVSVIFSKTRKIILFKGSLKKKSMILELKIVINKKKKILHVSSLTFTNKHIKNKKKIKALRNTTVIQLKQLIIESSVIIYKKLKTVGVGYRATFTGAFNHKLLFLKLGYSHTIYIKIPNQLTITFTTKTKFYVLGNSYNRVSYFSALIRSKKLPEPYKGKGILYENETIKLKKGKKI